MQAPGEVATACVDRLSRLPGVRGVLCFDEAGGTPVQHTGHCMSDAMSAQYADAFTGLLARTRTAVRHILDAQSDVLLYVSVSTRLDTEFVLAPDEGAGSGLAVAIVQGRRDSAADPRQHLYTPVLQMLRTATHDWLFGAAEE